MLIPCGTEHCSIFCHSDPSLCFLLCRSSAPCWMEQLQPGLGAAVPPSCCSPLSIDPGHGLMSPSLDNSSQQHGPGNGCATEVCSLPGRANNRAPNLGDRNRSHPSGLSIPRRGDPGRGCSPPSHTRSIATHSLDLTWGGYLQQHHKAPPLPEGCTYPRPGDAPQRPPHSHSALCFALCTTLILCSPRMRLAAPAALGAECLAMGPPVTAGCICRGTQE